MRILYLTDAGLDYLADQLYTGLCKILGWDRVIDYPYKAAYHDQSQKAWYLPQNPARPCEKEEILSIVDARGFDLVVLSTPRKGAVQALADLGKHCSLPPLVLVDGEDDDRLRGGLFRQYRFALYFKREYSSRSNVCSKGQWRRWLDFGVDRELGRRTFPLQFSVILENIPNLDGIPRELDISFAGRCSHRKRVKAVNLLKTAGGIRFEGDVFAAPTDRKSRVALGWTGVLFEKLKGDPRVAQSGGGKQLTPCEYFGLLGRSKIGLSIRGGGFDTLRYWEIVAARRLLLSEMPDITIPNNFAHGKHAVFCRPDLRDLPELVRTYARDDDARESIVAAGYQHLLKFHTVERRAEYFLDLCRNYV